MARETAAGRSSAEGSDTPSGPRSEKSGSRRSQGVIPWASIWRVIGAVLATLALLWALFQMRSLVGMIVISLFLSAALVELAEQIGTRGRSGPSRSTFISNYATTDDVVYESPSTTDDPSTKASKP